ncbi:MAG TPA: hypothetical protein VEH29_08695 [Acidimicrobiales bacterium]|nr:hypothetical protein [Acidimicrobiales bacterium]
MSTLPDERPGAHEAGPWKRSFRLLVGLGWLLALTTIAFVRSTPRGRRPEGEPATWKAVVWMTILFMGLFGLAAAANHWGLVHGQVNQAPR